MWSLEHFQLETSADAATIQTTLRDCQQHVRPLFHVALALLALNSLNLIALIMAVKFLMPHVPNQLAPAKVRAAFQEPALSLP